MAGANTSAGQIKLKMRRQLRQKSRVLGSSLNRTANASMLQKATLRSNNKALAQALECRKQELKDAQTLIFELREESQRTREECLSLQRIAGLKDDEIDAELQRRIKSDMETMKTILMSTTQDMLSGADRLNDAIQLCNSRIPDRGSLDLTDFTVSSSDNVSDPSAYVAPTPNIKAQRKVTALTDLSLIMESSPIDPSLESDCVSMDKILEEETPGKRRGDHMKPQRCLRSPGKRVNNNIDVIVPEKSAKTTESTRLLPDKSAKLTENINSKISADKKIVVSPPKIATENVEKSSRTVSSVKFCDKNVTSTDVSISVKSAKPIDNASVPLKSVKSTDNVSCTTGKAMDDASICSKSAKATENAKNIDNDAIIKSSKSSDSASKSIKNYNMPKMPVPDKSNKIAVNRRGTIVINTKAPELSGDNDCDNLPLINHDLKSYNYNEDIEDIETAEPYQADISTEGTVIRPIEPLNVDKNPNEKKSDKRGTIVIDRTSDENFLAPNPDFHVHDKHDTPMSNNDSDASISETTMLTATKPPPKVSKLKKLGLPKPVPKETSKQTKTVNDKSNESRPKAVPKDPVPSDSDSVSDISIEKNQKQIEVRLKKPGQIVFAAGRKNSDGIRAEVPLKLPTKSRSKIRKPKKGMEDKSPEKPKTIFDFHDKTPNFHKEPASVFDLTASESIYVEREGLDVFRANSKNESRVAVLKKDELKATAKKRVRNQTFTEDESDEIESMDDGKASKGNEKVRVDDKDKTDIYVDLESSGNATSSLTTDDIAMTEMDKGNVNKDIVDNKISKKSIYKVKEPIDNSHEDDSDKETSGTEEIIRKPVKRRSRTKTRTVAPTPTDPATKDDSDCNEARYPVDKLSAKSKNDVEYDSEKGKKLCEDKSLYRRPRTRTRTIERNPRKGDAKETTNYTTDESDYDGKSTTQKSQDRAKPVSQPHVQLSRVNTDLQDVDPKKLANRPQRTRTKTKTIEPSDNKDTHNYTTDESDYDGKSTSQKQDGTKLRSKSREQPRMKSGAQDGDVEKPGNRPHRMRTKTKTIEPSDTKPTNNYTTDESDYEAKSMSQKQQVRSKSRDQLTMNSDFKDGDVEKPGNRPQRTRTKTKTIEPSDPKPTNNYTTDESDHDGKSTSEKERRGYNPLSKSNDQLSAVNSERHETNDRRPGVRRTRTKTKTLEPSTNVDTIETKNYTTDESDYDGKSTSQKQLNKPSAKSSEQSSHDTLQRRNEHVGKPTNRRTRTKTKTIEPTTTNADRKETNYYNTTDESDYEGKSTSHKQDLGPKSSAKSSAVSSDVTSNNVDSAPQEDKQKADLEDKQHKSVKRRQRTTTRTMESRADEESTINSTGSSKDDPINDEPHLDLLSAKVVETASTSNETETETESLNLNVDDTTTNNASGTPIQSDTESCLFTLDDELMGEYQDSIPSGEKQVVDLDSHNELSNVSADDASHENCDDFPFKKPSSNMKVKNKDKTNETIDRIASATKPESTKIHNRSDDGNNVNLCFNDCVMTTTKGQTTVFDKRRTVWVRDGENSADRNIHEENVPGRHRTQTATKQTEIQTTDCVVTIDKGQKMVFDKRRTVYVKESKKSTETRDTDDVDDMREIRDEDAEKPRQKIQQNDRLKLNKSKDLNDDTKTSRSKNDYDGMKININKNQNEGLKITKNKHSNDEEMRSTSSNRSKNINDNDHLETNELDNNRVSYKLPRVELMDIFSEDEKSDKNTNKARDNIVTNDQEDNTKSPNDTLPDNLPPNNTPTNTIQPNNLPSNDTLPNASHITEFEHLSDINSDDAAKGASSKPRRKSFLKPPAPMKLHKKQQDKENRGKENEDGGRKESVAGGKQRSLTTGGKVIRENVDGGAAKQRSLNAGGKVTPENFDGGTKESFGGAAKQRSLTAAARESLPHPTLVNSQAESESELVRPRRTKAVSYREPSLNKI